MGETPSTRDGERAQSFFTLSGHAILPEPPCVYQPGSSPNPVLLGFYGDFIKLAWLIKSLAIGE